MGRIRQVFGSDDVYELMIVSWVAASPFAIARWVADFPEPVPWAAFIAGVIGLFVGWLVVAPHHLDKRARARIDPHC
jgi:hypothetical protein